MATVMVKMISRQDSKIKGLGGTWGRMWRVSCNFLAGKYLYFGSTHSRTAPKYCFRLTPTGRKVHFIVMSCVSVQEEEFRHS